MVVPGGAPSRASETVPNGAFREPSPPLASSNTYRSCRSAGSNSVGGNASEGQGVPTCTQPGSPGKCASAPLQATGPPPPKAEQARTDPTATSCHPSGQPVPGASGAAGNSTSTEGALSGPASTAASRSVASEVHARRAVTATMVQASTEPG